LRRRRKAGVVGMRRSCCLVPASDLQQHALAVARLLLAVAGWLAGGWRQGEKRAWLTGGGRHGRGAACLALAGSA
jgi:hypothetical protein